MLKTSSNKFGLIAILSTIVVLLLITALAVFGFFVKQPDTTVELSPEEPEAVLAATTVDPALAVSELGGIAPLDVINQAIDKARPGTALRILTATPTIAPQKAAGALLLLGKKFYEQNDATRAIMSYQLAGAVATLSPNIPDTLRADIFLQAGSGLADLNESLRAKLYLDQAHVIATESNFLQPAVRRSVLEQLSQSYLRIGEKDLARASLTESLSPVELSGTADAKLELPAIEPIPLPTDVQEAEKARWQAAQSVAKNLVELGGEVRPENLAALKDALLAEDAAKSAFFADAAAAELQTSGKINVLFAQIVWQSLKYRVASGAFGIDLVPEWSATAQDIRAALSDQYKTLFQLYGDMIVAIPDASQIDRATEELLRQQLLDGQLGLYPDYPAETLKSQLLSATARLVETQPNTKLRVGFSTINDTDYCILISDTEILGSTRGAETPATP